MAGRSECGGAPHEPRNTRSSMPHLWTRNRLYMGPCRGSKMKTYTDGYLDCLLDIKNEIMDRTIKELDTVLDEMIQDLRSL